MTNPAPPAAPASTRERLLDAAAELFYREGVGVGIDALCRRAGVSKRSMYQLFDSKDEVVAASLERSAPAYQAFLLPPDDDRPPRARILHVFERLEESATMPDYRGCPFVAAAVEVKSPGHPAALVARRSKDALTAFFRGEAERAGVKDPALLARQLTVAFDGAGAQAVVQARGLDGLAVATAAALLDAAGLHG
ncbi:AcrR family transcriptional regulator [Nonomuraea thailandensis]|uniref:AcrR family transcriptional regulator n=1 Tax=Nonomuraea thailandensis TaxID=1188745 RepID=A0A9X2GKD2_9ACTN|nr:TetR/AcrR family transcriptional regulator [Nonomuraea thailandensis]MCP2357091.1 AcrR family transcriptional regulator [Nonomuraea thailandensis]